MKTKLGIVGCGFLGNIVADAWKKGLLPDYELVGVTSRTRASAEKTAANVGCAVCEDMDALLALEPEYIVEAASVESVRAMAIPVLNRGVNLVILSIGAFADLDFYAQVKAAAVEGGAKVHLASGAIGGFDVLQTVTLMAQAQGLPETAGIETHTGAKGFRNTPGVGRASADRHRKDHRVHRQCKAGHCYLPPPGERGGSYLSGHHRPREHRCDHALRARLGGRRPLHHCRDRGREGCGRYLLFHQRHCGLERRLPAAQSGLARLLLLI